MDVIDWILNLACVLLWLNWRAIRFTTVPQPISVSLVTTLTRVEAGRTRRWSSLLMLLAILLVRSLFYYHIGSAVSWIPKLEMGAVSISFRSDHLGKILLYSLLGFLHWFLGLHAWLFLLSTINRRMPDTDQWQRTIRLHLGALERLPAAIKLMIPGLAVFLLWMAIQPLLTGQALVSEAASPWQIVRQAALLGSSTVLYWEVLLISILVIHVVNSYIYLGTSPFWSFVSTTATNLLQPLRWLPLRLGKFDLAPFVAIAAVLAAADILNHMLPRIYSLL